MVTELSTPLELRGPFGPHSNRFYLRNITTGVFAGDTYVIDLTAREGAVAAVRGTSATKVHSMNHGGARNRLKLRAEEGAALSYYEGAVIMQAGADFIQQTEIQLAGGRIAYAAAFASGRFAHSEVFAFRSLCSELAVRDECESPLYVERYQVRPSEQALLPFVCPPIWGQILLLDTPRAEAALRGEAMRLQGDNLALGFDELPHRCGYIVRVQGRDLSAVEETIEKMLAVALAP